MKKEKQRYGGMEVWMDRKDKQQKDRDKSYSSGFTLVELVIVIAIVIILSVVSVPIYRGYTRNAKMAEGYALLGAIFSAQKAYYSQYGMFLRYSQSSAHSEYFTCNEEVLGIDARGNKYFTAFIVNIGDNGTGIQYQFFAYARYPEELSINGSNALALSYNMTWEEKSQFRELQWTKS